MFKGWMYHGGARQRLSMSIVVAGLAHSTCFGRRMTWLPDVWIGKGGHGRCKRQMVREDGSD